MQAKLFYRIHISEYVENIIKEAKKIQKFDLCDSCLGRQFAQMDHGLTNIERGKKIRKLISKKITQVANCWLCQGIMGEIENYADLVIENLNDYEYYSFLVGSKIDEEINRKEKMIETPYSESIKREINREVGKLISKKTKKIPEFIHPDITAIINTSYNIIETEILPIFIYGRYNKFIRGIPQTKWLCRQCRGKGCKYCNKTGKMYNESVEELIAHIALMTFESEDEKFHGAGREDIDVLMLGNGRPFILEIINPKKRIIDLKNLQIKINKYSNKKIAVNCLRYAERSEIEKLKSAKLEKSYKAIIKFEKKGKLKEAVNALSGAIINQRTPQRVTHRRVDKVRMRKVVEMRIETENESTAVLAITAESGTYIKELITGDNNRTTPSLSELAGINCKVESLDVIKIGEYNEKN